MTQEHKELLLKDLCARLPHGVKVNADYINFNRDGKLFSINNNEELIISPEKGYSFDVAIEKCKPYLFPLSNMTEEQKQFFNNLPIGIDKYGDISTKDDLSGNSLYTDLELYLEVIDWLNKNHFDYRGLIEKGLAIDATGLNIY